MYAVVSAERTQIPIGSVMHIPGSWQDYCILRDSRGDSSIPRIKYQNGEISLMSPLPRHGRDAHLVARIVEIILESQDRNYEAFTPITMELPEIGGIEPDYCFYIDNWQSAMGKDRINWQTDPPPDLVIEIDVTSYTSELDFLPYKVPEVWLLKNNRLKIYLLKNNQYQVGEYSLCLPQIELQDVVDRCFATAKEQGTGVAISQLRRSLISS